MRMKLTDRTLRGLKPVEGKVLDVIDERTPNLVLRVMPTGTKTWTFRYANAHGRARRLKLGRYPAIGLADARELASEAYRSIWKDGRDPVADRRERRRVADSETFAALARLYIEKYAKPRKRTWKGDESMLRRDVPASWNGRPAREITRRDVRELIEAKAETAPIQANRLRALLSKVFSFAVERDLVDHNPVTGTPRPGVERARDRVLSEEEIRAFWEATESMPAPISAWWRLRLVTAQRGGEVAVMRWDDIDPANRVWTIPAEVAKNGLAHRVPLTEAALEIIAGLERYHELVMPGARNRNHAGGAIGIDDFKGHDLRRTAASMMAGVGVPRLHIAKLLNHVERGVTAVYDRHGYDREKRAALEAWDRKLTRIINGGEGAEVVPIRREAVG